MFREVRGKLSIAEVRELASFRESVVDSGSRRQHSSVGSELFEAVFAVGRFVNEYQLGRQGSSGYVLERWAVSRQVSATETSHDVDLGRHVRWHSFPIGGIDEEVLAGHAGATKRCVPTVSGTTASGSKPIPGLRCALSVVRELANGIGVQTRGFSPVQRTWNALCTG